MAELVKKEVKCNGQTTVKRLHSIISKPRSRFTKLKFSGTVNIIVTNVHVHLWTKIAVEDIQISAYIMMKEVITEVTQSFIESIEYSTYDHNSRRND